MSEDNTSSSRNDAPIGKLGAPMRYNDWEKCMFARLMSKGLFGIVDGTEPAVPAPSPGDGDLGGAHHTRYHAYLMRSYKAAGEIYAWLDDGNKILVDEIRSNPKAMWDKLKSIHSKSAPNSRFNSLNDLFAIRLQDDESLTALAARIQGAMQTVTALRPVGSYDIAKLDEELVIMTMIRALPREEYSSFISSVLLLSKLDKESVLEAFRTEETQRRGMQADADAVKAAAARAGLKCYLCDSEDHTIANCPSYNDARASAIQKRGSGMQRNGKKKNRGGRGAGRGDKTEKAAAAKAAAEEIEDGCDGVAVHADAAVCHPVNSPENPADLSWNADTGATAHMTPHREWITSDYVPWRVPIHLADNKVIYSTGKGTVRFRPTGSAGKIMQHVLITDVLYVPALSNNLLSVLTLTTHRGFKVTIEKRTMSFTVKNSLVFTATVDHNTTAYLNGTVITNSKMNAYRALVTVLDRTLLHRRMCHVGKDRLEQLIRESMTADLGDLDNETHIPEFCDSCINGKQHRIPFPHNADRAVEALERVFSDLHGPMPVQGYGGYKYWAVFIDDATRWLEVYLLGNKSGLFDTFKHFKALVEKQTGRAIKCLHNDEGGEFTLAELVAFCAQQGIRLEYTTRATPQQNGVPERLNRTMAEAITAMNTEANLPPSFWPFAAGVFKHVHNRLPTSALPKDKTPFEAFKLRKPKISHLRVYGCRAYVLVGRDKRKSLEGHTVKGVFVGYPANHAGWMVYVPETKKVIVSRDVIFNESEFPGISTRDSTLQMPSPNPGDFPDAGEAGEPYDDDEPTAHAGLAPPRIPLPGTVGAQVPEAAGAAVPPDAPPTAATAPPADAVPPPTTRKFAATMEEVQDVDAPPMGRGHRTKKPAAHKDAGYLETAERQRKSKGASSQKPAAPAAETDSKELLWDVKVSEPDANGEQTVDFDLNLASDEALILAGRAFVEHGIDFGGYGRISVNLAAHSALKVGMHDNNPRNYQEAVRSDHAEQWYAAMAEEMNNHEVNGTWTPVYLPAGAKSIGSRWVFKVKKMPDGALDRFKARVVAQGFSQRPGIDFDETFAPTARWTAVRTILALAAVEDMHLESVDITAAFLNSKLDVEDLFLRLPPGTPPPALPPGTIKRAGDGPIVGKLHKGMYGLKQGAHLWHKRMNEVFLLLGFARVVSDPCVYVYLREDVRIIIPVHVDDMTIASKSRPAILKLIDELRKHFKLRHLGPTSGLLGVRVTRDRKSRQLWIDQRAYMVDILARFSMTDCKPLTTPMDLTQAGKLSKAQCPTTDAEKEAMAKFPYIQATGALLYLALCTRPDIAYAVSVLCRFNGNPGLAHWAAVKHLLRYIRGTLDYRIEYSAAAATPAPQFFKTYSDADHGGNPDNGKSTTGLLIVIAGGAVEWSSKLQSVISMSTTEAEFVAASATGRSLCAMRIFLEEIGTPQSGPSELMMDNQSAISVSKQPEHMGRLKHLDRHYFWLRDAVAVGKVLPVFIPTAEMVSDLLTKPLARDLTDRFRLLMGVVGQWSKS